MTELTDSLYVFLGQHSFSIQNFPLGVDIGDHHHYLLGDLYIGKHFA